MSIQHIVHQYQQATSVLQVVSALQQEKNHFQISNLAGSSLSFVIAEAFKKSAHPFLLIFDDKEEAAYYLNDLEQLLGDKNVLFFPGSYKRPYQIEETDNANVLLRSEVLNHINSQKKSAIIVTYPTALFEKVVTKKELEKNTLKIAVEDSLSLDFVNEMLFDYKFKRVDFVTEPGDFSVRGGIIDVFSFSNNEPYRIEFFGDEIDSIRTFDVETQLSKEKLKKVAIIPNVENKTLQENRESFLTYISPKTKIFAKNIGLISGSLDKFYATAEEAFLKLSKEIKHAKPSELFCNGEFIKQQMNDFTLVEMTSKISQDLEDISFKTQPQPSFNKQFSLLIEDLKEHHKAGFTNYIFCANEQQAKRFHDIFDDATEKVHYETVVFPLYEGFVDVEQKIVCYTDHQIFERYHKFRLKNGYAKKQAITLQELNKLEIGDFVTHMDHGIGKFAGLQKIDVNGKKQEAIKLIYGDRDILYVSIHSLHKISKFNGKDGKPPKIYKLGSGSWKKITQKTKARVKHIAFNLIQLYAKRKLEKGFAFGPDTHMQHELESSFIYEDTPDQFSATQEVKNDMEKAQPMDRLVCGDVGFGKTEVAVRAAFKAVDNGKQVAILVPTTILAFQHFQTFSERLRDFPIKIDYLNRFRTTKEKSEAIEGVNSGAVDIIIGTHQLTNQKLKFKDLGLLIIDEEQKFGVAVKDKLKTLKENVDTLTLTATPIPRTLQFSLMAARDLSVIKTPPPNRHPIESHVIRFSEETIRDAISYEISRGGQVFFIHNRIENIQEVAGLLQRLLPSAKIGIGHGQMEGKKLENLMLSFMNGEFDVLVSTTIIESGLDVPNANTIFINNANNFGLSDLHQMRGRVGRSNKKAFCYFITPPYHMMTDDARKRITALEVFADLGSGINIAMKDLEIRGAGDLLGGEQSGFINDIGFDTYQKILQEAIEELKENEFKDLYPEVENTPKEFVKEVQIDTDFEILFPDDYINSVTERLSLYNKLGELTTENELQEFEKQLIDRFGELPTEVDDLLDSVRIKWLAKKLGLEKIILKQKRMVGYFVADQQSNFYQTETFTRFLKYVQQHSKDCVMKEKETNNGLRLLITFIKIDTVKKALETLANI
ncbi:transcription-repair coupling factor [Polaribacter gangjinensis]|uniref:Transcription-repair-coupling factor n=1 Tax=Polaribacter gangjinensis TaxID=574710 RepID=A0A2S7WDR0_9FLAO|nr:transcription-repair coupling factor [Polaribacter gangjinensis]PQJ75759.1 transcription-repair coupling factor [Polaribacter gangjinensis]